MTYFDYHRKAKKMIKEGLLDYYEIVEKWNSISPALVLHYKTGQAFPIREEHWDEYVKLINQVYKEDFSS